MTDEPAPSRSFPDRLLRGARTRILVWVIGLLVFSAAASILVDRALLLDRVGKRVDASLTQEAQELRRLVRDGRNPATGRPFGTDARGIFRTFLSRNVPGEGEEFFAFVDGRPLPSTASAGRSEELLEAVPGLARIRESRRGDLTLSGDEVRYLAVPLVIGGRQRGVFVVTAAIARERAQVTDALRVTAIAMVAVLVIAAGIAFLAAGRVLAPIRQLTDTARSISETDLTRRIPVEGDDELAELATTFNAMLDRLESAFASQRDFLSDAGHELRTPLTVIRGHLELLGDDPAERAEIVELLFDELDRMGRLVDELLLLARAQRPDFLRLEDVDLDVLTDELMTKARALADRDWELATVGTGRLTADRQRLTQAVMNLARNAADHTSEGDTIEIGSSMRDGVAALWVRDHGPGIAAADRDRIFDRFVRGAGRRPTSEGAGLGLAIVKAVAEAHGGQVTLETREGRGTVFTIVVPSEPGDSWEDGWNAY